MFPSSAQYSAQIMTLFLKLSFRPCSLTLVDRSFPNQRLESLSLVGGPV